MSRSLARSRGGRPAKRTVLLATNGVVTEAEYLHELRMRAGARDVSITVRPIEGVDPYGAARKLAAPASGYREFDEIWLLVDKDAFDLKRFLELCRAKNFKAIVSNPCFEVWLVAHYTTVRPYQDQRDAARHLQQLAGSTARGKHLPDRFPWHETDAASGRCGLDGLIAAINEVGPSPSTAMPHLIRSLHLY